MVVGVAVDGRLREILGSINEISSGSGGITLINTRWPDLPAPLYRHILNNGTVEQTPIDLLEERKDYARIDIVFGKGFGKGPGYVGQSASLGEGHNFR